MLFRWAAGRLWLLAALMTVALPAPLMARGVTQRLAVVLSGPQHLVLDVQRELTLPLSAEASIVQTSDYRRAAAHIGILRHPRSNRAAPFVGRALGAQFVLLIDGVRAFGPQGPQDFVGVRLIHSASGQVLHDQRYYLPQGAVTPSIAEAMLQKIVPILRGRQPLAPESAGAKPGAAKLPWEASGPEGRRDPWDIDHGAASPPTLTKPPRARPSQAPHKAPAKRRASAGTPSPPSEGLYSLRAVVGPTLGWRRAQLVPLLPTGQPIPYGSGVGLGRPMGGAGFEVQAYRGRFGLEADGHMLFGKTSVRLGQDNEVGQAQELHLHGALAVMLALGPSTLSPRAGFVYDRLPVTVGPFVGTSYTAAAAGLHVTVPSRAQRLQLSGTIDAIFLAAMGMEAARAGHPHLAQGVVITLTPELRIGAMTLALNAAFDYRAANFTGNTALYSHARYTAMALTDIHVRMGLLLGGTL